MSGWATRNIKAVLFVTVALCLVGAWLVTTFPVSILPDVTFPRVVVIAEAGERPSRLVEVGITRVLEEAIATVPGVTRIRSKTQRGASEISIDFAWGSDILLALQLVNARINEARPRLPAETEISVERMNPTVFPILGLSLQAPGLSPSDLWSLATYTLKPRLSRVPGVARVVVQGGRVPEIAVEADPARLAAYHLTLADIEDALAKTNVVRAVGRMDRQFQQYQVLVSGELSGADALGEVVVAQQHGVAIPLRSVATVRPSVQDRTTVVTAEGAEAVLLNIVRQPDANTVAVVEGVRRELGDARRVLPPGTRLPVFYDQSVLIRDAVASVRDAVLLGALLAVVVLLLFLGDLRATLVTAAIIPATVLITFLLMRLSGLTMNLMTLGALAVGIGLVIDDAIVVVENVFRHLSRGENRAEAVARAAREIAAPMVSSTLTTVVVFLPLVLLSGVAGAFFTALAITLTIALLVSLALALLVSPSLCAAFLRARPALTPGVSALTPRRFAPPPLPMLGEGETEEKTASASPATPPNSFSPLPALGEGVARSAGGEGGPRHGVRAGGVEIYERLLRFALRRPALLPIVALACLGLTALLATRLPTGFMPAMDEGAFILDYQTPPGTSLAESNRILLQVERILKDTPEVGSFSRRTGTELGFFITEPNTGDFAVTLKPRPRRPIEAVMDDVRGRVEKEVPGIQVEFVQILQDIIGDLAGAPAPVEVKLFGEDQEQLDALAKTAAARLEKTPGFVDVVSGVVEAGPELVARIDPLRAGRVGLTPDDVASQANAALFGNIATQILQGDRQIGVRVRYPAGVRDDKDQMARLPIRAPGGFRLPLSSLGTIERVPGTTEVNREDQRRMVAVTASLEGRDLGGALGDVRRIVRGLTLPPGVSVVLGGQFQSQADAFRNLLAVLGLAVLLVFAVMVFQFGAFTAPTVILLVMPLSLLGVVLGLWATGTALNVSSFMGAIMLVGIVVKNGILLLDRAQQGEREGLPLDEAVLEAGRVRLRPILMTTLTAILGLVPLALGLGAGAEMQKPLAIAVIGGLSLSTVFTLVLAPLLYVSLRRWQERRRA